MNTKPNFLREAQLILVLQWIFICAFGWVAGTLFMLESQRTAAVQFGITAIFLGIAQWLVLRNYARMGQALFAVLWIVTTSFGVYAGSRLSQIVAGVLPLSMRQAAFAPSSAGDMLVGMAVGGLMGMVLGLVLGVIQLPLIFGRMRLPYMWIIVNIIGWGIGLNIVTLGPFGYVMSSLLSIIFASTITGLWVAQQLTHE